MQRMRGLFLGLALSVPAAAMSPAFAADWVDYATVSMTDPVTPKLTNRHLCFTDGSDVLCESPSPYLTSGGLLGIGTTNPQTELEVNGTVSATNFVGDGSGLTNINASAVSGLSTDRITSGTSNVTVANNGSVTISTAGGQRMVVGTNGNVGIGTVTPSYQLTVAGGTNGNVVLCSKAGCLTGFPASDYPTLKSTGNQLYIDVGGAYSGFFTSSRLLQKQFADFDNGLYYLDPADATTSLLVAGKVGVGTTNPNAKLDVYGDISATNLRLSGNLYVSGSQSIDGVLFANGGVSATGTISATRFSGDGSGLTGLTTAASGTGAVQFSRGDGSLGGDADTFYWDNGNKRLGIGTAAPAYTLDVSGSVRVPLGQGLRFGGTATTDAFLAASAGAVALYNGDGSGWQRFRAGEIRSSGPSSEFAVTRRDTNADVAAIYSGGGNLSIYMHALGRDVLTIMPTGNVGISTSTPNAKLDVIGTISASNVYVTATTGTVSGTYGYFRYISGTYLAGDGSQITNINANAIAGLNMDRITSGTLAMTANSATSYISLSTNGTTWGYFGNANSYLPKITSGQIGAGTTNPAATLQVSGSLIVSTSAQTTTPSLYVGSSGDVGVGTNAPGVPLDIYRPGTSAYLRLIAAGSNPDGVVVGVAGSSEATVGAMGSNKPLRFVTSSTERVRIDGGGNVGIGTSSPVAKLDVAGTISASDAIQVGQSTLACASGISGSIRWNTTSGTIQVCNGSGWISLSSGTTGAIASAAGSTGDIQFNNAGALAADTGQFYWDATNNRLGIGTNSPNYGIEVSETTNGQLDIGVINASTGASSAADFYAYAGGNQALFGIRAPAHSLGQQAYVYIPQAIPLAVYTSGLERMRIAAGGNVGIGGIATPTASLQVSGSFIVSTSGQTTTPSLYVGTNGAVGLGTSGPNRLLVASRANNASGTEVVAKNIDQRTRLGAYYEAAVQQYGYVQSSNDAESVQIALALNPNGGKVGVGKAAPVANFDVNGTISASDAIQVSGSTLTCSSAIKGAMRYSNTSSTLEYCNSTAWTSLGPSDTAPVSFSVNKNGTNQTFAATTWTKLTWSTEEFDTNNNFDTATNRFTPTVKGKYLVTLTIECIGLSNGAYCIPAFYKNGASYLYSSDTGNSNSGASMSAIVDMNGTTDYLEAYAYSGAASGVSGYVAVTRFAGVLLGPQAGGGGGTATPAGSSNDVQYNNSSALAADTGNFTYTSGVLKAPTISGTYVYGNQISGTAVWGANITYTGTITDISDRRRKHDIAALPAGDLERMMLLKPVSFKMSDDPQGKTEYGFIAQEVREVYPILVHTSDDASKTLSLNYTGLIAPMVQSIQELKRENDALRTELKAANDNNAQMERRLEAVERRVNVR